jgi:hypothetical protein
MSLNGFNVYVGINDVKKRSLLASFVKENGGQVAYALGYVDRVRVFNAFVLILLLLDSMTAMNVHLVICGLRTSHGLITVLPQHMLSLVNPRTRAW